jgi:hypothetical protein
MNRSPSHFISPRGLYRKPGRNLYRNPRAWRGELREPAVGFSRCCITAILLLSALNLTTAAQDDSSPRTPDFSAFQLLTERNIFNPNRSTRPARTESRPTPRNPQVDRFTLVGTLGDDGQWTAFFDGSRSELRGRLRLNDTIGDYTVTAISNSGVQLDQGTNRLQLRVGMQLRREDNGPWLLAEREADATADRSASRQENSTSTASTSTGAADNDVLLRLRQKRERELQ